MTIESLLKCQPALREAYYNDPIIRGAFYILDKAKTEAEKEVIIATTLWQLSKAYREYRQEIINNMNKTAWDGNRKD